MININTLSEQPGIEISDPTTKGRFELYTPTPVSPTQIDVTTLSFPVEKAVEIRASAITIPKNRGLFVRTSEGEFVFESSESDRKQLPEDEYIIELGGTSVKLYISVSSSISFVRQSDSINLGLDGQRGIVIGARSQHKTAPGTITVTDDAEDVMRAMSFFGSSLKTTSSERSYPTLRDPPPLIQHSDEFHVPSNIEQPSTGVKLVLPPKREYLYPATSLVYYLGATIEPGKEPRLLVEGDEYELSCDRYETAVERMLQQVFLLDCVTRTEGFYSVTLYERELIEPRVDLDFSHLFEAPLTERLTAYLDVPFRTIEPAISSWNFSADVVPSVESDETLPLLANDLALVRIAKSPVATTETEPAKPERLEAFYRESPSVFPKNTDPKQTAKPVFEMERKAETRERAWVGPGYPFGVNKLTTETVSTRFAQEEQIKQDATIEVTIICNDPSMEDESAVQNYYYLREIPEFDISIHHQLTVAELAHHLTTSSDFLHYIGHISDNGIRCVDGYLDVRTLSEVNVTTFLLNACSSYEQGTAMIKRGARSGVATLSRVGNELATNIGQSFVRLLSTGFSVRNALTVINQHFLAGYRYIALGDGKVSLCQGISGLVLYLHVEQANPGIFYVNSEPYLNDRLQFSPVTEMGMEDASRYYALLAEIPTFELSASELDAFFDEEPMPVEINGDLYWSDEITADDVAELL